MTHYSTRPKRKKNPVFTKVQQKTAAYTVQLITHTHYIAKSLYSSAFTHTYELE